jgi:hypothetical protein
MMFDCIRLPGEKYSSNEYEKNIFFTLEERELEESILNGETFSEKSKKETAQSDGGNQSSKKYNSSKVGVSEKMAEEKDMENSVIDVKVPPKTDNNVHKKQLKSIAASARGFDLYA